MPALFFGRYAMDVVNTKNHNRGFTLIELVSVLLILGIVSSLVVSRNWAPGDSSLSAQAELLARNLRHTQAMALSRGNSLTLEIQAPNIYAITDGATPTSNTLRDASSQLQTFTLENGVTLSGGNLSFDSLGRPLDGSNLRSVAQNWILSGESSTSTVQVQPLTGFITVTP